MSKKVAAVLCNPGGANINSSIPFVLCCNLVIRGGGGHHKRVHKDRQRQSRPWKSKEKSGTRSAWSHTLSATRCADATTHLPRAVKNKKAPRSVVHTLFARTDAEEKSSERSGR